MFLLLVAAIALAVSAQAADYLLVSQPEIEAAKRKAESHAWARQALDNLIGSAESALSRDLEIPPRAAGSGPTGIAAPRTALNW